MSGLTKKSVEIVASRALGPGVQVLDYQLEPFSKSKHGIFGSHQLLSVNVRAGLGGDIDVRTCSFFVKSPPESSIIRQGLMDEELLQEELHFYREVYPLLGESRVGEAWAARCYLVERERLVMEDLRRQGYASRADLPLDDPSFLECALGCVARFHAACISAEARLGRTLREAFPRAFTEKMFSRSSKFGRCTQVGFETVGLIAQRLGLDASLLDRMYERALRSVARRPGRCNVLCHSDLWKNNLLLGAEGTGPSCRLVDFQLLRYGSPACDIGMLVYLHTSPAFRRSSEFALFDLYYAALRDALLQCREPVEVPGYQELREDYRELRLVGMSYAITYTPSLYLKPEVFEELLNEPAKMENWFFRDRMAVVREAMDADPVYERKIREVLEEFFEEGRRIFGN